MENKLEYVDLDTADPLQTSQPVGAEDIPNGAIIPTCLSTESPPVTVVACRVATFFIPLY